MAPLSLLANSRRVENQWIIIQIKSHPGSDQSAKSADHHRNMETHIPTERPAAATRKSPTDKGKETTTKHTSPNQQKADAKNRLHQQLVQIRHRKVFLARNQQSPLVNHQLKRKKNLDGYGEERNSNYIECNNRSFKWK